MVMCGVGRAEDRAFAQGGTKDVWVSFSHSLSLIQLHLTLSDGMKEVWYDIDIDKYINTSNKSSYKTKCKAL